MAPRSVAILGASPREGSFGNTAIKELIRSGFNGSVFPINPKHQSVEGYTCFPDLNALDRPPELVLFCVANERLEEQFKLAADIGIKAAVIFGSCYLDSDTDKSSLLTRLRAMALDHNIRVCGGNCMGFRNIYGKISAGIFDTSHNVMPAGPVAIISHSGTAFGLLSELEGRLGYTFAVSAGQEISTTAADYLDYALTIPETRCIAMLLEMIRDPANFARAVKRAHERGVPVVVVKVGRTEEAARFAVSHSGAMVGNDAAYDAFFERHGVVRVDGLDELVNAIQLFAYTKPLSSGGLAVTLDSGGKRELLVDIAKEVGMPFAKISDKTQQIVATNIDSHHDAVNPLDYWGTGGADWMDKLVDSLKAMAADTDTALSAIASLITWGGKSGYSEALKQLVQHSEKPVAMIADFIRATDHAECLKLNQSGIAVLEGERAACKAIRSAMWYRDFLTRLAINTHSSDANRKNIIQNSLKPGTLNEADSLVLLRHYGIPTPPVEIVSNEASLLTSLNRLSYPLVLKTATTGISHKSDVGGVFLNIESESDALNAYQALRRQHGANVLVTKHITDYGIEMALGLVKDPLVGSMVMIGIGGTLIEFLDDQVCVIAPTDVGEVYRAIDKLKCRQLLDGVRGKPAVDINALANTAVALSNLTELGGKIAEVDINPILVKESGCIALDALVVVKA